MRGKERWSLMVFSLTSLFLASSAALTHLVGDVQH